MAVAAELRAICWGRWKRKSQSMMEKTMTSYRAEARAASDPPSVLGGGGAGGGPCCGGCGAIARRTHRAKPFGIMRRPSW